jgi:tRNA (guanine37-N1)-methyltransferase
MRIDILTLFPPMFAGVFDHSIIRRARDAGKVEIVLSDIRGWAEGVHRKVDDRPFGGGPGMVMLCQPVYDAVAAVEAAHPAPATRILMSPAGERLTQGLVRELSRLPRLLLLCGHYEGLDERISVGLGFREVSIGDYVLTGGELPAMVLTDAVVRLLPGVLGNAEGPADESFSDGLLEYPQYTRPRDFRGMAVPDVLLSGNHAAVDRWRREQSLLRTRQRRADLRPETERKEQTPDPREIRETTETQPAEPPSADRPPDKPADAASAENADVGMTPEGGQP